MIESSPVKPLSWAEALQAFLHPRVITMLFLGFSAGIPILLIFSSLSLWLGEAGVERKAVTFFSWAALGYSFKFVWAPLIDKLPLPFLTAWLGKRRAWLLVAQALIILAIVLMGNIDPSLGQDHLVLMAWAAVLLGFSSATQDVVIDAYRIEAAETRLQAMMSSTYIAGYRLGMIVAGAGALFLASWLGSEKEHYVYTAWQWTYWAMAATMLVGVVTTLVIPEPEQKQADRYHYAALDYLRLVLVFAAGVAGFVLVFAYTKGMFGVWQERFDDAFVGFGLEALHLLSGLALGLLVGWVLVRLGAANKVMARDTWIAPIADFFRRYGVRTALLLLALIGLYRITDIVPGVISNVFYQDLGFSKPEIATAVKTFGVVVSIAGGFLGGLFATRYGVMRTLMLGAILTAFTNLVFVWLAYVGHDVTVMYTAVTADNLAAGFASAAFVAFLSSLTSVSFTAVQYAIFSSLMTLLPKTIGGYSGTIVDNIGYPGFFTFTTLIGIPVLWLVWAAGKHLQVEQ
ncbi:AmpG family muropeptide MFS transporter [Thiothrix subterranea]|uniref:MFS transporter n=1 Tax=Thiothrix subterranea TaxID=2735563 RepID=A0AA51QZP9_9GAMM|nr:MFS transporter [Thiothrix subterranea]MDQ5769740.1 MFS transporter [Thiothrix subterranea]WML87232.1 MFS transporter [Thiothrix subterranea]